MSSEKNVSESSVASDGSAGFAVQSVVMPGTVATACGLRGKLLSGSDALLAMRKSPHFQCAPDFDAVLKRQLESEGKTVPAFIDCEDAK